MDKTTCIAATFRLLSTVIAAEAVLRHRSPVLVEYRARQVLRAAREATACGCGYTSDECSACARVRDARRTIESHAAELRSEARRRGWLPPSLTELRQWEADEREMEADRARSPAKMATRAA